MFIINKPEKLILLTQQKDLPYEVGQLIEERIRTDFYFSLSDIKLRECSGKLDHFKNNLGLGETILFEKWFSSSYFFMRPVLFITSI